MTVSPDHLTRVCVNLDNLTHNLKLLQSLVGGRPMWPAIKANAYGHGREIIARHLVELGYSTLCVAHVSEAVELTDAAVDAEFILLSATLPAHSETIVAYGCEPTVCTFDMIEALASDAEKQGKTVRVHVMVDTGMGRIGIKPEEVSRFLERCRTLPRIRVRGLMSHLPCADAADKTLSQEQIAMFKDVLEANKAFGIDVTHMANSAAILDLPDAYFDAVRPGISIYGLSPSKDIANPCVQELRPVLEWKTRISFLKEVPAGTGLSYGHTYHAREPSLIATVPLGYGDGLSRNLSNNVEMLVRGERCPQVGTITMDQSMIDVTRLRGQVTCGDEVVVIGKQAEEQITADELADKLDTINYEIVTGISQRVPRFVT